MNLFINEYNIKNHLHGTAPPIKSKSFGLFK